MNKLRVEEGWESTIVGSVGTFPGSEVRALEDWSLEFSHLSIFPPWTNFHPLKGFPPSCDPIFGTRLPHSNFRTKCVGTSLIPRVSLYLRTCRS